MYINFIYKASRLLYDFLIEKGIKIETAALINVTVNVIILLALLFLIDKLLCKIIVRLFSIFSGRTKNTYDDFLVNSNFPKYTAHVIPFLLLEALIPSIFKDFPETSSFLLKATDIYLIILVVWIFRSVIKTTRDYLKQKPAFKEKPLDSFAQVFIMIVWFLGFIFIFSEVAGQSITQFLATLGAASAIIILLFKDTILGFVASIQVSINDMVRINDWITVDKYGADGNVIEINLTTVKVQNFDNTITTLPTYRLISDSFKNWRGMEQSGGRRIKRSLFIKVNSIRFLSANDLEQFGKIDSIAEYIDHRQNDINSYNTGNNINTTLAINGRNQTNMGLFRKYIDVYLNQHPAINKDMMIMARQLQPTNQGIPIEIYAFSKDKRWENYEYIMADIFDHLLASVSYFDLECFELPTGNDFNAK